VNIATFTLNSGLLVSNIIPAGLWNLNFFASVANPNLTNKYVNLYWSLYSWDGATETLLVNGAADVQQIDVALENDYDGSLYVPVQTLASTSVVLRVKLFVQSLNNPGTLTLKFQGASPTHLHTSISTPGNTGATGFTGFTGATGPQSAQIYSGAGAPSEGVGTIGDFYVDTANGIFYGPKT
jgi:hypothetical protein